MLSITRYLTVFDIVHRAHIGLLTKPEPNLWKGYSAGMVMCTYIYISSSTKAYHLSDMVLQTSRFIKSILIQITKYSVKKELKWILTPDVHWPMPRQYTHRSVLNTQQQYQTLPTSRFVCTVAAAVQSLCSHNIIVKPAMQRSKAYKQAGVPAAEVARQSLEQGLGRKGLHYFQLPPCWHTM